jgi:hypothetical protein
MSRKKIMLCLPIFLARLQGCVAGIYKVETLSESGEITPEKVDLQRLVIGARLGLVDNRLSRFTGNYLLSHFFSYVVQAQLFQKIHHPMNGQENVIFELGADATSLSEAERADAPSLAKAVLCGGTLLLICPPMVKDFWFDLEVHAIQASDGVEINRYRAKGRSRVRYGVFSAYDARDAGLEAAMDAAFGQVINMIKQDREKYLPLGPPAPPQPKEGTAP